MKKRKTACLLLALTGLSLGAQNPYLPLWEHIPDGEPYVFEDPDNPGKYRVYVYGSHDNLRTAYCGLDQVVWSAPVEDLSRWRYDGVIFESRTDANGNLLNGEGKGDLLYAPDVAVKTDPQTGKKTYYLYPNTQNGGRQGTVAKADRPDGPFSICNWSKTNPQETEGVLRFDPAVFVDDDGRVYGYWGFQESFGAELDPETMATVKPGTQIVKGMITHLHEEGEFRFFEASSIRKIKDKYVFIYSRWTKDGEFGLKDTNYTLAYAYSDNPLGPFVYGGTIIDARARDTDLQGNPIFTATPTGNTHGSIAEIEGQWYVFYHRQSGTDEFARQAMVAPITVDVTEGPGGKVVISEGEYTSEGFQLGGLDPLQRYSAGIACYYTGPGGATNDYPNFLYTGSYVQAQYLEDGVEPTSLEDVYDLSVNHNPVVNNTSGSVVGYKYFNFDALSHKRWITLRLQVVPKGVSGRIEVIADSPWKEKGGILLGRVKINKRKHQEMTELKVRVRKARKLKGKHALYLRFTASEPDTSLCDFHYLQFTGK